MRINSLSRLENYVGELAEDALSGKMSRKALHREREAKVAVCQR